MSPGVRARPQSGAVGCGSDVSAIDDGAFTGRLCVDCERDAFGDVHFFGAFERRLALPCDVDPDRAEARYRNGVLTVRLPRSESDRRKRIAVKGA